jgi:hypothetical protein
MVLYIHSDVSYLSEPKVRSRSGGHFFLSDRLADLDQPPIKAPTQNGPLHISSVILRNVMALAAEAVVGALLFVTVQEGTVLRTTTLIELGHPQPPIPLQSDNATATGIINASIRQRRSNGDSRLSICAFIGSATASNTVTSSFTGALVPRTWPTTLPSTIQRPIAD